MLDRLTIPIIQAPMLGATSDAIAVAVSRTGALGSLAAAGLSGAAIRAACEAVRAQTDAPFAVNTFIQPNPTPDPAIVADAIARLRPWRLRYGLPEQSVPNRWCEDFDEQFSALLESAPPGGLVHVRVPFARTGAGAPGPRHVRDRDGDERHGSQGLGRGRRRCDLRARKRSRWPSRVVPERRSRSCRHWHDGARPHGPRRRRPSRHRRRRHRRRAGHRRGADARRRGVQIGTAYLLCDESTINPVWRRAIETAPDDPTALTRAISGRMARGIENAMMRELRPVESDIAPYPDPERVDAGSAGRGREGRLAGRPLALGRPRRQARAAGAGGRLDADALGRGLCRLRGTIETFFISAAIRTDGLMTKDLTHFVGGKHVAGTSGRFGDVYTPRRARFPRACRSPPPTTCARRSMWRRPPSRHGPPSIRNVAPACSPPSSR